MNSRNTTLDLLRAVAVLAVIVHHYAQNDTSSIFHIGLIGVDLFFVLSGFLISSLLFAEIRRTDRLDLIRFVIRRALKIYPAFYTFLLLTFPIVPSNEHWRLWGEVFFLQQYAPHVWPHTWTLSIEETFYLAVPLGITALHRLGIMRSFPVFAVAIIIALTALRMFGFDPPRFEGLALGSWIGYTHTFHALRFRQMVGWWSLAATGLFLLPQLILRSGSLIFTFNVMAFAFLVSWSAVHSEIRVLGLNTIGRYSYSIYIWHMLPAMVAWLRPSVTVLGMVADTIVTLSLGIGMGMLIEMPVIKLRDRVFPRRCQAIALIPNTAAVAT